MSGSVDMNGLIECARRLAELLEAEPAPDERVRSVVHDVLFERETIALATDGIITQQEAATLLLAHLQTTLFPGRTLEHDDPSLALRVIASIFDGVRATRNPDQSGGA